MTNSPILNHEVAPDAAPVLHTALYQTHLACGGKMVPFAGWEMPVQYAGVTKEVLALRAGCGLFDVGHMGQLDVRGAYNGCDGLECICERS
jgi:aminomethyltransferase